MQADEGQEAQADEPSSAATEDERLAVDSGTTAAQVLPEPMMAAPAVPLEAQTIATSRRRSSQAGARAQAHRGKSSLIRPTAADATSGGKAARPEAAEDILAELEAQRARHHNQVVSGQRVGREERMPHIITAQRLLLLLSLRVSAPPAARSSS